MIKKLENKRGVKLSSTLAGQRELLREYRNKINEIIDYVDKRLQPSINVDKCVCPCPEEFYLKRCPIHNPPHHKEASKGECKKWCKHNQSLAGDEGYFRCNLCNPPEQVEELEKIKFELLDKIDEFFPKIKPQGSNGGRVEAAVIVGIAIARFNQLIKANFVSKEKIKKRFEMAMEEANEPGCKVRPISFLRETRDALIGLGD